MFRYDRRKTADKLSTIVDSKKASRLAEKILQLGDETIASLKVSKKRSHDNGEGHRESKKNKPNSESSKTSKDKSISNGSTTSVTSFLICLVKFHLITS